MSVRMTHVHLPDVPRLVRRRVSDLDAALHAVLMDSVDVVHPDRHPDPPIGRLADSLGRGQRALPATTLASFAEEDLAVARADATERRRVAPVPALRPAEPLEPGEALLDARDVQDRGNPLREH